MIRILDKSTIKKHILPHLSRPKRGGSKHNEWEIVNAIIYKLKTGVQWSLLPVKSLIYKAKVRWGSIYHHFRKWALDGTWELAFNKILKLNKSQIDLSVGQLDGTHTIAKRGGVDVEYQGRKKAKTSNTLWLTDRQGLAVAFSPPISGNHHDVYDATKRVDALVEQLKKSDISVNGLFVNADAAFDCRIFRNACEKHQINLNVPINSRNTHNFTDNYTYFDDLMYKERFVIERNNAWQDSYRTLLIRQDTSILSWTAWHYIVSIIQWCKKLKL
jgi:transposase